MIKFESKYRKTLFPVPLNDRDPFNFDRGTRQRVYTFKVFYIYLLILLIKLE